MLRIIRKHVNISSDSIKCCSTMKENILQTKTSEFETVFSFPFIKYISLLNRLKVYQILGTSVAIPGCGILELLNAVPSGAVMSASYIGITGATVLSLVTLPFRNTIGYLYISNNNEKIKISSMDFWGRRKEIIVPADNWIPLLDMGPRKTDVLYLTPQLSDGSKFKLFIKFGKVLNTKKMGQVLE